MVAGMRFRPDFVAAYLGDNMTGSGQNMQEFEAAADEWEQVAEVEATFGCGRPAPAGRSHPLASPLTRIDTVLQHMEGAWLEPYLAQVLERPPGLRRRLTACLPWAGPAPAPALRLQARQVQAAALVPFDNACPVQLGMLCTVYRQLTGDRLDPPRYGSHWEDIGFQGADPATDLRGVGILGLVQATHLVTTPELLPLARAIHTLSRRPDQEFPLLVLAINISRIALHALRDGLLDRLVEEEESAWAAANSFYAAVLLHVYTRWRQEHLTIVSCGPVLQEAERSGRRAPGLLVRRLERALQEDFTVQEKQAAREQVERDSRA